MFRFFVLFGLSFVIRLVCSCNMLLGNELSQGWSTPSPNAGRSAGLSSEQHWETEGGVGRWIFLDIIFLDILVGGSSTIRSGGAAIRVAVIVSHSATRMAGKQYPS